MAGAKRGGPCPRNGDAVDAGRRGEGDWLAAEGKGARCPHFVPVGGSGQMTEQLMVNDLHTGQTATVFNQSQILASDDAAATISAFTS
jgi:hypothetical protein